MDEVDIDNVEDLNELEARLYAQIHHEATEEENHGENALNAIGGNGEGAGNNMETNYETSSHTNRILARRYWASSDGQQQQQQNTAKQQQQQTQQQQQNSKQRFIRNPFKTPNQQKNAAPMSSQNKSQQPNKQFENQTSNLDLSTTKTNENSKSAQNSSKSQTEKTTTSIANKSTTTTSSSLATENTAKESSNSATASTENKKNKTNKSDQQQQHNNKSAKQKLPTTEKSNLKLNPVVDWMERNKQLNNKKANNNNNNVNSKNQKNSSNNNGKQQAQQQGPFAKQQQKLQKAKRLENKKQKSKKAKNTAAALASKLKPTEIIDLDTDSESDSSDVIMIPIPPPPTYTVDDSGDEGADVKVDVLLEHEENALDSTDVQMSSTSGSFIKPQSLAANESADKRLDNSSRCTSPCSIQSSDDFIGQNDRSRLLAGTSGMADDEDLLLLTSDMNSLLEAPETVKQAVDNDVSRVEEQENPLDSSVEQLPEENVETNDSLEFATPKTSKKQTRSKDYRVDQGQFRALDVYESESDITDSVYSKGTPKNTVIRQIDSSSDEVEDIGSCSQRTKRLRKRRASSSNKESDPNNEDSLSSSDNEEIEDVLKDDNEILRTPIAFIARGEAVERSKPRKRCRTLSTSSPIVHKRKSGKTPVSTGHMSDTEFINTLNNLVQGQEGDASLLAEQDLEEEDDDESETENIPTARDIAEKILAQQEQKTAKAKNSDASKEIAVPEDVLNELDKVFETIDQLDKREAQSKSLPTNLADNTVDISDSSDSDREKNIKYKSAPNEDVQIIKYSPKGNETINTPTKTQDANGSPIYNVIYLRGQRKPGGIGWNDEMRRFYNNSWNGEHFIMSKVLQKMNPDKNLWRIYTEDRFNIKSNKRHNNMKCTNCCEFGHMRSKCKRPRKPMICYMCGDSGHQEPRCPNTICLRCGNKTQVFTRSCNSCTYQNRLICPICKIRGHTLDYCPDKWRRYHSTTEPNTYPNSSITYNTRKFCCICGGRGHLSDNCRSAVRFLEYPANVSTVKSHQKSYGDVAVKTPHNGIALNLMYDPCQEYKFDLVNGTSVDKYYGRFLKAVNLDYLLKRKRHVDNTEEAEGQENVETGGGDTAAKKAKRLSKKYEANPYSKVGVANQKNVETKETAPNQVQEISESGNTEELEEDQNLEQEEVIDLEDNSDNASVESDNEVELVGSTVEDDDMSNIQINTINKRPTTAPSNENNFKSPKNVTSSTVTPSKKQTEPPLILDSDSNYSFSEHFDDPSTLNETSEVTPLKQKDNREQQLTDSRPKPREMEVLPDFIPLIDSTEDPKELSDSENATVGISRRFVAAETDDEMDEEERRPLSPLPELPCEAKIYLTHMHSKYLLSPIGNGFLVKTSRAYKLKARLDFTSVGHVLVIFGLPSNQDKFQRELLMKYRELEDENNQKHLQSNLNVPKRTDVLIRFLRDNITQLLTNLGNVNQLLKRLQFLERQQTKSGYKLAERVRRSLNMILVGQAGLLDGTMHLDKLLVSLKSLMNDYNSDDVLSPQMRSEIADHWKMIFSPYRHENYQQLVSAYNKLISKNRMPKLVIDPLLLGQKVLDTTLSEEQKQKLEQPKPIAASNAADNNSNTEAVKEVVPNPLNQKNAKSLKRKQNSGSNSPSSTTSTPTANKTKATNSRPVSPQRIDNNNPTPAAKTKASATPKANKTQANATATPNKTKTNSTSSTPTSAANNKSKQPTSANDTPKKQTQKIMPPPPFANPEKRSTVSTTIQEVSDKWKSTCDTLLTEISSDKPKDSSSSGGRMRDSKLPSTFWSRESMRYLDDCVRLAGARPHVVEKLQRVQNKSKNGQLSYNDYLAVIKLHTALNGK